MDLFILETTALFFILFLLSQMVIFRLIPERHMVRWLIKIQCIISAIVILASNMFSGLEGWEYCYFVTVVMMLFWLLWLMYMMTVYSYIEASITIRLLMEIAMRGSRGATKKEILRTYNPTIIIARRIDRLIQSGEFARKGSTIHATDRVSMFQLRDRVTKLYFILFAR